MLICLFGIDTWKDLLVKHYIHVCKYLFLFLLPKAINNANYHNILTQSELYELIYLQSREALSLCLRETSNPSLHNKRWKLWKNTIVLFLRRVSHSLLAHYLTYNFCCISFYMQIWCFIISTTKHISQDLTGVKIVSARILQFIIIVFIS